MRNKTLLHYRNASPVPGTAAADADGGAHDRGPPPPPPAGWARRRTSAATRSVSRGPDKYAAAGKIRYDIMRAVNWLGSWI